MIAQLFTQGLDFTGVANATGSDHNQLINLAVPYDDGAKAGKGMTVISIDSALNTPSIPDASTAGWGAFKRFLWIRLPHASATDQVPIIYAWNDDADDSICIAAGKKWVNILSSSTSFQAQIDALVAITSAQEIEIGTVSNTANAAQTLATSATTTANTASTTATAANNTANGVNNALNASKPTWDQAAVNANAALAKRNVNDVLNVGGANQQLRTNAGATAIEWFTPASQAAFYAVESKPSGTDAGASLVGANVRQLNTSTDVGTGAGLSGGVITMPAGTYLVNAFAVCWASGANQGHQVTLKDGAGNYLLSGAPWKNPSASYTSYALSTLTGLITLAAPTNLTLVSYVTNAQVTYGLGRATSLGPPEVYSGISFFKLA